MTTYLLAAAALAAVALTAAVLALALVLLRRPGLSGQAASGPNLAEPRLAGTWQSDADATMAAQRRVRPVPEEQEAAMWKLFGKMRVTFKGHTYTSEMNGEQETGSFQVLRRDADSALITSFSTTSQTRERFRVQFLGPDTYRLFVEKYKVWEYFRRVE